MTEPRTYLDYNASAPLCGEARTAMVAALDVAGNPSSVHAEGRRARAVVEEAREKVARLINARPSEVVFTSGATEANAWVMGAGWDQILHSAIEHVSVTDPALATGAPVVELGVEDLARATETAIQSPPARGRRRLVSVQLANNETGEILPLAETLSAVSAAAPASGLAVHSDAVQAVGRIPVDFAGLGLDAMSLSAHKLGGPKGVGALVVRDGFDVAPLIRGGGQERRRRAGTENVAAIAGFGAAAEAARRDLSDMAIIAGLRDRLEREVRRLAPQAAIVSAEKPRLPNTTCIALPGMRAETLVIRLDLAGVAVGAGAACSSGKVGASRVLEALGLTPEVARSAIRVSLGRATTSDDVDRFLGAFAAIAGRSSAVA